MVLVKNYFGYCSIFDWSKIICSSLFICWI